MRTWILKGILVTAATFGTVSIGAEELPAIKLDGVATLETGAKMYRKLDKNGSYEIGDVVQLQDEKRANLTRKAKVLRVGNKSVVIEVLATTE